MLDDNIKQTFTAQTNKTWIEFSEEAYHYFAAPHSEVMLGFWFGRETGRWSYLQHEEEWTKALVQLHKKIRSVKLVAVAMQIKNMVSHAMYDNEGM